MQLTSAGRFFQALHIWYLTVGLLTDVQSFMQVNIIHFKKKIVGRWPSFQKVLFTNSCMFFCNTNPKWQSLGSSSRTPLPLHLFPITSSYYLLYNMLLTISAPKILRQGKLHNCESSGFEKGERVSWGERVTPPKLTLLSLLPFCLKD